jgi:RHS repeat-associated protein
VNLPGGSYIDNSFDGLARLVDTHLNTPFGGPYGSSTYVSQHQYSYDSGNQRTQQVFAAGNYVNYTYDSIAQLTSAKGYEPSGSTRSHEQFGYGYDSAWNLNLRTNNGLVQSFIVNTLNELTNVAGSGTLTVAGTASEQKTNPATFVIYGVTNVTVNSQTADLYLDGAFAKAGFAVTNGDNSYTAIAKDNFGRIDTNTIISTLQTYVNCLYDLNGNMVTNGTRIFDFDDENQLVRITEPGSWKSEFSYDGMMRRRIRKEFTWQNSSWLQTNEVHYVYDGMLVIQEREGDNLPRVTYTRGHDLSGSLQGVGGIGGLLARTDNSQSLSAEPTLAHNFYFCDGNGNITVLVNTNGEVMAHYAYDPYGNLLLMTGPLAIANVQRFCSEPCHDNSGLYYYGYRFYSPILQRWLNRDPIEEYGGINQYGFVFNGPTYWIDLFGLKCGDPFDKPEQAAKDALAEVNPKSITENKEYGGEIYQDSKTGKYAATNPEPGDDQGAKPHTAKRPSDSKLVGDYHTHGDYSIYDPKTKKAVRTSDPKKDSYHSDDFSSLDKAGIIADAATYGKQYRGYLGTPSKVFKEYDPTTGTTCTIP